MTAAVIRDGVELLKRDDGAVLTMAAGSQTFYAAANQAHIAKPSPIIAVPVRMVVTEQTRAPVAMAVRGDQLVFSDSFRVFSIQR